MNKKCGILKRASVLAECGIVLFVLGGLSFFSWMLFSSMSSPRYVANWPMGLILLVGAPMAVSLIGLVCWSTGTILTGTTRKAKTIRAIGVMSLSSGLMFLMGHAAYYACHDEVRITNWPATICNVLGLPLFLIAMGLMFWSTGVILLNTQNRIERRDVTTLPL